MIAQAGIDTWSPAWYVNEGTKAHRAMSELATVPATRSRLLEDTILGHRVGWFPASGLVFAEGHPGGDRLGCPDDLPAVLGYLEQAMWDHGIPVSPRRSRSVWASSRPQTADRSAGFAGVRRLDATCDLAFASGAEGLAVLAGVAAMPLPRMKSSLWRAAGDRRIETVGFYGSTGKKMLARWYDKSVESGSGPPGTLIRPEDQRRWPAASRRDVEELTSGNVREKHRQRFLPLWRATKGVTVGGIPVLTEKIAEAVEAGELSPHEAIRAAGYLLLGDEVKLPRKTRYRHRRLCDDHGLVLADGVLQEVEVDLHDVLDEVMESDAWGRGG